MMKYFNIDGVINIEMQKSFTEFANQNQDDDWSITIFSTGGTKVFQHFILDVINSRAESVTLIAQEIYSAAFDLFYSAKCRKKISFGGKGMVHLGKAEVFIMSNGKPSYFEDVCLLKNFKGTEKKNRKQLKKILTDKEFKKYKRGDDVYFTFKRMKEIFSDAEVV